MYRNTYLIILPINMFDVQNISLIQHHMVYTEVKIRMYHYMLLPNLDNYTRTLLFIML